MAETNIYDCPYRVMCSDNGGKCETCANNPKRSYYRPVEPYVHYLPYNPSSYIPSSNFPYYVFYYAPNGGIVCC